MRNAPSLYSLNNYLALVDDEQALLLVVEVAVAAAIGDPDWALIDDALDKFDFLVEHLDRHGFDMDIFTKSLRTRSPEWRTMLAEHPLAGDETRLATVCVELCTNSDILDDLDDLYSAEAVRRIDCILDVLEVSWSADVLMDLFAQAGAALLGEPAKDWLPGAVNGAKQAAEFLSFFHPVAGIAAQAALQLVPAEAEAAGAYGPEDLARLLATCLLLGGDEQVQSRRSTEALSALRKDVERTSRRVERVIAREGDLTQPKVQSLLALQRYQAVATGYLKDWCLEHGEPETDHIPSTVGQRLPQAKVMLAAVSVDVASVQDTQEGLGRMIMSESNWVVVAQEIGVLRTPERRPTVILRVKKHNE